jgi:muramidase (phage lysozyme)
MARLTGISKNLNAFLDMLSVSEGTSIIRNSDDGYNVVVGGTLFSSYADHPRKLVELRPGLKSTAAGRYQVLKRYYDVYKQQLKLPDFSPVSQDKIAIQQIKECKALKDIEEGSISAAIALCSNIWASLPGAGYGQHEHTTEYLLKAYAVAGGELRE